jgi:hypothetical protein
MQPRVIGDIGLVPEALFGLAEFIIEVGDAVTTKILQFHPLQVVPDSLSRVQLRRIAWKLLQVNLTGRIGSGTPSLPGYGGWERHPR